MTLVRIPSVPTTNKKPEFDQMITELGYPPLEDLDDDSQDIAEHYDGLLDERSAFARRGWFVMVDCKTGGYDPDFSTDLVTALLGCAGCEVSNIVEHEHEPAFVITVLGKDHRFDAPLLDDDFTDGRWMDPRRAASVAERMLAKLDYELVELEGEGELVYYVVLPSSVASAIAARGIDASDL